MTSKVAKILGFAIGLMFAGMIMFLISGNGFAGVCCAILIHSFMRAFEHDSNQK